jgi:hypothetical protein
VPAVRRPVPAGRPHRARVTRVNMARSLAGATYSRSSCMC